MWGRLFCIADQRALIFLAINSKIRYLFGRDFLLNTSRLTAMPSELGQYIRDARQKKGIGVREFARLIGKSPAFVTNLEMDDRLPSATEDTWREIAKHLTLDPDDLITKAGKVPQDVVPEDALEVALYRKVKALSHDEKQDLMQRLANPTPSDSSN
jgi:transcriptional regulator with XRE-family HTH domain